MSVNFSQFTSQASPVLTDNVVGYVATTVGGERRTTLAAALTLFQTNSNLSGDVTSVGLATTIAANVIVNADVNSSAAIAYSKLNLGTSIVNADISASAAIVDTKLATISTASKVSNSATTATDANTASAIVARDASGNFSAGTVSAALTGTASTATALATARTIAITGDLAYTSPSFDGTANVTAAGTLATVATAGTSGGSTAIPVVTINAKGLTTSITTAAVVAPAGTLTGATLASGVTASSLTSLGTIGSLVVTAGTISTTPSASTDIANKLYVDTVAQGLDAKASCVAATTANITLSGTQTVDGIVLIAGNRVLVKNQTLSQNNGIYLCAAGAWTRTTDADTWDELTSAFTFIETGTTFADCGFVCTADAGGTLGTTALPWSQFSGAGSYTASTGLTLTGTVFSLTAPVTVALGGTNATSAGIGSFNNITGFTAAGATGTTSTNLVFSTSPTITSPTITGGALNGTLGSTTPSSVAATTGTFSSTLGVTGVATLGNGAILGTPASGTVTNLSGTASININGTVGATTPSTVAGTTGTFDAAGTADPAILVGAAGTGVNAGTVTLRGGSGTGGGAFVRFTKNATAKGYIGNESAINGNASDDLSVYGVSNVRVYASNTQVAAFTSTGLNSTAIGATTASTGAFTTLAASGITTLTAALNTNSTITGTANNIKAFVGTTGAGTGFAYGTYESNGGTQYGRVGIEGSSGGVLLSGTGAYDFIVGSISGSTWIGAGGQGVVKIIGGGAEVTGTLSATGDVSITGTAQRTLTIIGDSDSSGDAGYTGITLNWSGAERWNIGPAGTGTNSLVFRGASSNVMTLTTGGALTITGALSKGSGSFRIEHPLPSKSATHQLVHSFIEGPKCDLIYRGKIDLVDGKASVNIDADSTMTEGTFEVLCANVQCFTSNESGWGAIRGKVVGNILTIEAQDAASTDNVSWMVIGERKDPHIMDTDWTDKSGRPIVEPLKPAEPALESK